MASSSTTCSDDQERFRKLREYLQKKFDSDGSDLSLKPIKTKPEKLPLRGLPLDLSVNNSSLEYYPDSPVSVPFLWESQPGTPKLRYRECLIPPLTPKPARKHVNMQPKSFTILQSIFPKLSFAKIHPKKDLPRLSYSTSQTFYSVPSSPYNPISRAECRESSSTSPSESGETIDDCELPSSTCCSCNILIYMGR